ncbi:MAG TPA: peptidylprolyl isomerase [Candidatus Binatia bacterium]|nr:peptidylprolyl isomerase [Candidatus Binatia bacterium]
MQSTIIALTVLAGALTLQAAQPQATAKVANPRSRFADLFDDTVLARGRGVEVKQSELDDAFLTFKANLASRGQSLPEDQRLFREKQILDRLIIGQILAKRATDADKAEAKEITSKYINDARKDAGSEEAFLRSLKPIGVTAAQLEERIYREALADAVVKRELKSTIKVSDAQVDTFYRTGGDLMVQLLQQELEKIAKDSNTSLEQLTAVKRQIEETKRVNLARLQEPEKVRVSHILLLTRNPDNDQELPEDQKRAKRLQMDRILSRAKAGEDFAKLVKEYSEDRMFKGTNTLTRDDRSLPEFKAAAFSLEPGKVSDVVTTSVGHYILKLHERIAPRKIELEKATSDIREHLTNQELQRQMPDYFSKLRKDAAVEILDAKYRIDSPKETDPAKPAG